MTKLSLTTIKEWKQKKNKAVWWKISTPRWTKEAYHTKNETAWTIWDLNTYSYRWVEVTTTARSLSVKLQTQWRIWISALRSRDREEESMWKGRGRRKNRGRDSVRGKRSEEQQRTMGFYNNSFLLNTVLFWGFVF